MSAYLRNQFTYSCHGAVLKSKTKGHLKNKQVVITTGELKCHKNIFFIQGRMFSSLSFAIKNGMKI